jgi:1,2-phenylacetyl-CoA epoxidase PaaB subunit
MNEYAVKYNCTLYDVYERERSDLPYQKVFSIWWKDSKQELEKYIARRMVEERCVEDYYVTEALDNNGKIIKSKEI